MSTPLPQEVITCLEHTRYLHLATSTPPWPHISLMNFTYLPSSPFPLPGAPTTTTSTSTTPAPSGPVIVMTLHPTTRKSHNLALNPRVSMLVHDWVSPREGTAGSPAQSGLAAFLTNLNTGELGRISATLNGYARVVDAGSEEEKWYWEKHRERNPGLEGLWGVGGEGEGEGKDGVRVVVVRVGWVRVSDWKGGVRDWVAEGWEEGGESGEGVNGTV